MCSPCQRVNRSCLSGSKVSEVVSDDSTKPTSRKTVVPKMINQAKAKVKTRRKATLIRKTKDDGDENDEDTKTQNHVITMETIVPTLSTGQIVAKDSGSSGVEKIAVSHARAEHVSNIPVSITNGGVNVIQCTTNPCDTPHYKVVSNTGSSSMVRVTGSDIPGEIQVVRQIPNLQGNYAQALVNYQVMMQHNTHKCQCFSESIRHT